MSLPYWFLALLLSFLTILSGCDRKAFTKAQKKRYRQDTVSEKSPLLEEVSDQSKTSNNQISDQNDIAGVQEIDGLDQLGQRRLLTPMDLPGLGNPTPIPPPIDPFTGGPVAPLPPPPEPPPPLPMAPIFERPICGDKLLTVGEECDDGNTINGDGCSSSCKKEYCGNGFVELGEQCDRGLGRFTIQGPDCDQYCQFIICGDFYVTGNEQCDDGNREDCDGCSRDCQVENPCDPRCQLDGSCNMIGTT